jgi:hypothetical protein
MATRPQQRGSSNARGGLSSEALRKRYEESGQRQKWTGKGYLIDEVPTITPKEGANAFRIVQPLEVDEWQYYGLDVFLHRNVGPDSSIVLCPSGMFGHECPICALRTNELWETDKDLAKSYYPEPRVLMWVMDMKEQDPEKKGLLRLWSCGRGTSKDVLGQSHKKEADVYIDISDPDNGRILYFDREGQGIQTKYKNFQISESAHKVPDSVLDQRVPMADLLITYDAEEIRGIMEGKDPEQAQGEGERPSSKSAPAGREERGDRAGSGGGSLDGMDKGDLLQYILDKELDIRPRRDWSEDDIRAAIAEAEGNAAQTGADIEEPIECFGKLGTYDDCDECPQHDPCAEASPQKRGSRPNRPEQPKRQEEQAKPEGDDMKSRMQEAIRRKKAEIAASADKSAPVGRVKR